MCAFLLLPIIVVAQGERRFGIHAGATYSSLRGNEWIELYDVGFNYIAGISYEHSLGSSFSLVAYLNYERKTVGRELTADVYPNPDDLSYTVTHQAKLSYTLDYLTLPINLKYYFKMSKGIYLTAGAYIAHHLDTTLKDHGHELETRVRNTKSDYGLNTRVGLTIPVKTNRLNFELRYNRGLAKVNNLEWDGPVRTASLNAVIGWQFQL